MSRAHQRLFSAWGDSLCLAELTTYGPLPIQHVPTSTVLASGRCGQGGARTVGGRLSQPPCRSPSLRLSGCRLAPLPFEPRSACTEENTGADATERSGESVRSKAVHQRTYGGWT